MNERRIARIQQQIKERVATVLVHDIADPRLGFVTISRVEVDKELQRAIVFWSVLGDDKNRRRTAAALEQATGFIRREVAKILHTRTVPTLVFRFDESLEGSARMRSLLDDLRREREARGETEEPDEPDAAPADD